MVSPAQQLVLAFTAALCCFIVVPRMFGSGAREERAAARKGPPLTPGGLKGALPQPPQAFSSAENMQQMKKLMEQELRSDKYKSNSKGYVFTLMPLYAIGVGIFAAYKFLKIKSAEDTRAQKEKTARGIKKSEETENQLNELEQRLAQTEKMLNSILTQLDPLTNCVKSVAMEQKNEIMSQLQCIRDLMKKRGMQCPPTNTTDAACERNLDNLIESLTAMETLGQRKPHTHPPQTLRTTEEQEEDKEMEEEEHEGQGEEEDEGQCEEEDERRSGVEDGCESDSSMPSLEELEVVGVVQKVPDELGAGLRRRNRPD
ncbi:coiled-coil domain-containing protein 107 [Astyanax mexicanus]|uniref:coiled-coil domain-containing protein 107 n=1 Tax=Astyanax mexicanus TaxID=7994 RepID=UPI0020CAF932|nr:coiled-coil domain-containing protein 107 [Astyanax mexicanus]